MAFWVVFISSIAFFFLTFHIVVSENECFIIAKDNLTFSKSIVSVNEIIKEYNNAPFFEKQKLRSTNLCKELIKRGAIETQQSQSNSTAISTESFDNLIEILSSDIVPDPRLKNEKAIRFKIKNSSEHSLQYVVANFSLYTKDNELLFENFKTVLGSSERFLPKDMNDGFLYISLTSGSQIRSKINRYKLYFNYQLSNGFTEYKTKTVSGYWPEN